LTAAPHINAPLNKPPAVVAACAAIIAARSSASVGNPAQFAGAATALLPQHNASASVTNSDPFHTLSSSRWADEDINHTPAQSAYTCIVATAIVIGLLMEFPYGTSHEASSISGPHRCYWFEPLESKTVKAVVAA
jgi:hypothetical protein